MQHINTPDGKFHDGNPATGELGTIVNAVWLNAVDAELSNTVIGLGGQLDATKNDQIKTLLLSALSNKANKATTLGGYGITDAAPLGGSTNQIFNVAPATDLQHAVPLGQMNAALSGKASKATTLAGYGIADGVTQSALSAVTSIATESTAGISAVATSAQTSLGVDDAAHVTPKKLRWGFNVSLTTNGFIQFPAWLGGFMIQWVTGSSQVLGPNTYITGNATNWVTQFPTSCLKAFVVPGSIQSVVGVSSFNTTAVVPYLGNLATQGSVAVVPIFIGIGN